jgi:hypothetical protein
MIGDRSGEEFFHSFESDLGADEKGIPPLIQP